VGRCHRLSSVLADRVAIAVSHINGGTFIDLTRLPQGCQSSTSVSQSTRFGVTFWNPRVCVLFPRFQHLKVPPSEPLFSQHEWTEIPARSSAPHPNCGWRFSSLEYQVPALTPLIHRCSQGRQTRNMRAHSGERPYVRDQPGCVPVRAKRRIETTSTICAHRRRQCSWILPDSLGDALASLMYAGLANCCLVPRWGMDMNTRNGGSSPSWALEATEIVSALLSAPGSPRQCATRLVLNAVIECLSIQVLTWEVQMRSSASHQEADIRTGWCEADPSVHKSLMSF